jgi:hypothetical protein
METSLDTGRGQVKRNGTDLGMAESHPGDSTPRWLSTERARLT